ncbi:cutinase family protein [Gordonia alkanivorans]|uniref:cutinase family protein n=1 Tax=Gordonia alkanivorans TaxID=84096 RepID=UPI0022AEA3B7|nr:cutinase family protein [Gordonia alkanivorans]
MARTLTAGVSIAASAAMSTALVAPVTANPAPSMPSLPAPLNLPGLDNALGQALQPGLESSLLGGGTPGGGALIGPDGRTNIPLPLVPQGGVRKQFTAAPATEQSTRPACAPFMLIAVPGTFEINRDDDPSKATGVLQKLIDPLKRTLGSQLGYTLINYDADSGVNGTSYARSTENGKKKTLATLTDAASRCPNANLVLAGFSQGADIAGDVATDIGNKRTAIDPRRISAVVLYSDPQRGENSNVIVGTNQSRPDVPAALQKAFGALANDPSFAQMQLNLGSTVTSLLGQSGLAGSSGSGQSDADAGGSTTSRSTPSAGSGPGDLMSEAPQSSPTKPGSDIPQSQAPETSDAPDVGDTPSPTSGEMAGASLTGTGRIQLISSPPRANPTDLAPVKADDQQTGDRDPNTGTITATITASGLLESLGDRDGQGPHAPVAPDEIDRRARDGHSWNRSNADKDKRRDVVNALFVFGSDICKDKTLQQCREAYVDATSGEHPGLLVPSADLNAMYDKLASKPENKGIEIPASAQLTEICAGQTPVSVADCRRKLQWSNASEPVTQHSTNLGGLSESPTDPKTFETLARAQFVAGTPNESITTLGTNAQGIPLTANNKTTSLVACKNTAANHGSGSGENFRDWVEKGFSETHKHNPTPGAGYAGQSNAWLLGAWQIALKKQNDDTRLVDLTREDLLARTVATADCDAWAALTVQNFLDKYRNHQIVYNDDKFVAPNGPADGNTDAPAARARSVGELYSYGGCGEINTDSGVTTAAPSGTWSLDACRKEYLKGSGRYSKLSDTQVAQVVTAAKKAYEEGRPAWSRDVLTLSEAGIADGDDNTLVNDSARRKGSEFSCSSLPVDQCAIFKTRIDPTNNPPAGEQTLVQPLYPTVKDGALIAPEKDSPREKAGSETEVNELKGRGFILADDHVLSQVAALDLANKSLRDSPAHDERPSTLIKKSVPNGDADAEGDSTADPGSVKLLADLSAESIDKHLANGWVWGRTDSENVARAQQIYQIYTLGGCTDSGDEQQTWKQCFDKFMGVGDQPHPENAWDHTEVQSIIDQLQPLAGELPWVATSFPEDLNKNCPDKIAEDCAQKKRPTPTSTPTSESRAPDAGSDPAPTTTPNGTDDSVPGPSNGSDTTHLASGATDENPSTGPSTSSSLPDAGDAPESSSAPRAGSSPGDDGDGGLATEFADTLSGRTDSTSSSPDTSGTTGGSNGEKVSVTPITQRAVAGGGLAGPRDVGFGELTGRVISFCVPGDLVCSLPANSQLAQDLIKFAQNVSVNFPDMLSDEGATRMGGLLALQAINMVTDITGLPRTKISSDTLQALINIAAGGAMLAMENPAGAALVAQGVAKLPDALPEVFAQLSDIPEILRKIPTAPDTVLKNTGLDRHIARVNEAFKKAGMTSPLDIEKYPAAVNALMEGLVKDNTGVVTLVTDPQYWKANAHMLYPELKVAGSANTVSWVCMWVDALVKMARGR